MRDDIKEETMIRLRTLLGLAACLAALLFVAGSGCNPQAGDHCDGPGYTTRVEHGKRTSLSCEPSGIDSDGHQEYRWVKA
jgi:hypothetical protein